MRWIESKEGLLILLKYGEDTAKNYQYHLDNDDYNIIEWLDDQNPLDFDTWLEEFEDQVEWENSDELKALMNRG